MPTLNELLQFKDSIEKQKPKTRTIDDLVEMTGVIPKEQVVPKKEGGFFSRLGARAGERFSDYGKTLGQVKQNITTGSSELAKTPEGAGARLALRTGGLVGQLIGDVVVEGAKSLIGKTNTKKLAGLASKALSPIAESDVYKKTMDWAEKNPQAAKDLENVFDIATTFIPSSKAISVTREAGETVLESSGKLLSNIAKKSPKLADDIVRGIPKSGKEVKVGLRKLISAEPDEKIKTVLQRATPEEVDNYIKIAENFSKNRELKHGFEVVGDKLKESAFKLKERLSNLGRQKETIIERTKLGKEKFTKQTAQVIEKMKGIDDNSGFIQSQIEKLKKVRTKQQADKAIDEIQSDLYNATNTNILARGSVVEQRLKGVLGEYNEMLKNSLPSVYRKLNEEFSSGKEILEFINSGLSKKISGTTIGGASLIKQFFSPTQTKTKEIFKYLKDTLGVDLAKEATLAKFAEELYGNPNVRSLLSGGIPTSPGGVINKLVDFGVEKTGLGRGIRDTLREGTIEKAKGLTGLKKTIEKTTEKTPPPPVKVNKKIKKKKTDVKKQEVAPLAAAPIAEKEVPKKKKKSKDINITLKIV